MKSQPNPTGHKKKHLILKEHEVRPNPKYAGPDHIQIETEQLHWQQQDAS